MQVKEGEKDLLSKADKLDGFPIEARTSFGIGQFRVSCFGCL